jgi:cysteinyl-tRNA synthetase
MVLPFLGNAIDIHAGGIDNLWRHHDYNLAIVESLTGREYARYWMHGGHLLLEGKKMSKSRGNIVYLADLLSQGYSPEEVRFFLIYGHYRDRMNMTGKNLDAARRVLGELRGLATQLSEAAAGVLPGSPPQAPIEAVFQERMDDDLDVKGAVDGILGSLRELAARQARGRLTHGETRTALTALHRADAVLQVIFPREETGPSR